MIMKRLKLVVSFIYVFTGICAQNWSVFPKDKTCIYSIAYENIFNSVDKLQYSQKVEVSKATDDSITYKIITNETCMRNLVHQPQIPCYKDCYTYLFSDTILVLNDTTILKFGYLGKTKYFKIKGNSSLGEQWECNDGKIKCICDSIINQNVFEGWVDSVKVFSIQSLVGDNFKTIARFKLSKNHGLVQFPAFEKILFNYDTSLFTSRLSKIEKINISDFHLADYFHLNVGDKLFREKLVPYWDSPIPDDFSTIYETDSVVSALHTIDSVVYEFYSFGERKNHFEKYYKKQFDYLVKYDNNTVFNFNVNLYSNVNLNINSRKDVWRRFRNEDEDNGRIDFSLTGQKIDLESCQRIFIYDYSQYFALNTVVGLVKLNDNTIIGSIVNGQENGNITKIPTSIRDKISNYVIIYPNPFTSEIKISGSTEAIEYTITSIMGTKLSAGLVTNNIIDVSNLASGTYFITIKSRENTVSKKITKI